MNGEKQKRKVVINSRGFWRYAGSGMIKPMFIAVDEFPPIVRISETNELYDWSLTDQLIALSECPCDPRRRHERLGQKVAVV